MLDFNDFDPDDLDDLDFSNEVPGTQEPLGAATRAVALAVPERAHALVAGETGLRFDSLVLFAEPAFRRFDLDLADAFAIREDAEAADPEVVALLEGARLMWAYFELPPPERARCRNALAVHLLGAEPSDDDWVEIEGLLDVTEPYWEAMSADEHAAARQPDKQWLDWSTLTAHPTYRLDEAAEEAARGYGPDGLSELEARALFAQPLLEQAAASGDVDAVESAMERASHYWQVAQAPAAERSAALANALELLTPTPAERESFAEEAKRMIARYGELFEDE